MDRENILLRNYDPYRCFWV